MQTNRRNLLASGVTSVLLANVGSASAQDTTAGLVDAFSDFRSPDNYKSTGPESFGTGTPLQEEIRQALLLFKAAPSVDPDSDKKLDTIAVARYFEQLQKVNNDGYRYNYEWPIKLKGVIYRANPLITGFFTATHIAPAKVKEDGDQLAWCAAFVNSVLMLSGRQSNWNPMSGGFRKSTTYPSTNKPKPGDLVVFQDVGKKGADGAGHVTFFLKDEGNTIRVLGGNQRGNTGSTGAVCETSLPKNSATQFWHSYRSVS